MTGSGVAELSLVSEPYVLRNLAALAKAETLPPDRRVDMLTRAAAAFSSGIVNDQSADEHEYIVSRVSGMPISVVRAATRVIARNMVESHSMVRFARPQGAVTDWRDPTTRTGRAVWTRRGRVFAVHAAGAGPCAHAVWPEALALGYRVAVRPSRHEPFTPHRLVKALQEAGFGPNQLVLLPTDRDVADGIIRVADLAMIYGGDEVTRKYGADPRVLPLGPGRSKILLTGSDWESYVDTVVDSIIQYGGATSGNATAVFVEDDPAAVANALAKRLADLPSLRPEDDRAVLPVQRTETARTIERHVLAIARGTTAWLGGDGVVDDLGDGSAALRPAVFEVRRSTARQIGVELPFPCVWVAPWSRHDGIKPLSRTLTLTAITDDEQLIGRLLDEPTISNVHIGDVPTHVVPHNGRLAEFLMRTKAVLRA